MGDEFALQYVRIALALERLQPGSVEVFGADQLPIRPVLAGRTPSAAEIVRAAGELADSLPADTPAQRADFLRGQLRAIEWTARRLAGQAVGYLDEVRAAFDVTPVLGAVGGYREAHRELDGLLKGGGSLAARLAAHRRRDEIPPDRLDAAVHAMSEALRERTAALVGLPEGEQVSYQVVDDAPWSALHRYDGGFASRISVNAGARPRRAQLAATIAHEAYPGHHAERCHKEAGLVADGWDEHRVVVVHSPQGLVAEGAAELALEAVIGPGWGPWAADVLAGVGLGFDGALAEQVADATAPLARVRQDAALQLHHWRLPEDEVLAYIARWALVDEERAGQMLRFVRHPLWRSYVAAYVEGAALMQRWWRAGTAAERLRRALDEPLTPNLVRTECDAAYADVH